jgi:ribonuclease HI
MDVELIAIFKALSSLYQQSTSTQDIYIFVDSQAALKRLQKISLTGGQQVCYEITELCRQLATQNNKITISWVPGHEDIQGNEHADRLAKAGLQRKAKDPPTSLSYLKSTAKENILAKWKQSWQQAKKEEKGKLYSTHVQDKPKFSLKLHQLRAPKKTQAAYFQLKLGKGFFKQFSKTIGKDDKGECFGNCKALQTPKHLLLHCKHYRRQRQQLERALGTRATLAKLLNTQKGRTALTTFLQDTEIATAEWLLAAGDL